MKLKTIYQFPEDATIKFNSKSQGTISNQPSQAKDGFRIFINSSAEFQTIKGIGGSFSELGSKALFSLDEINRVEIAEKLFSKDFNFYRLPIGASDFALKEYSLNDNDGDFEMENFSLDHDKKYIIPYMSLAKDINPNMEIHASPWSPPAWLKSNKSMLEGGHVVREDKYYRAYAKYFVKYIEEYKKLNFNISRLNVQNETDVSTAYPSCVFNNEDMTNFIKNYLSVAFKDANLTTEIFAGTYRSFNGASGLNFLTNNDEILAYISGLSFQYSIMTQIQDVRSKYPTLKLMHTESNCHRGANSYDEAVLLYTDIIDYMNSGCDTFTYWNMILNETKLSTWNWAQNSLVSINENTHEVTYNPDFYVMKVASSCIKKGSKKVSYTSINQMGLATKDNNGEISVLTSNFSENDVSGKIVINQKEYDCTIPAKSMCVFTVSEMI